MGILVFHNLAQLMKSPDSCMWAADGHLFYKCVTYCWVGSTNLVEVHFRLLMMQFYPS
eukprot:SAG11_NODE_967_length_6356_cov_6.743008_4_plen_58_part_00